MGFVKKNVCSVFSENLWRDSKVWDFGELVGWMDTLVKQVPSY